MRDLEALGWGAEVREAGAPGGREEVVADAYDALILLAPREELDPREVESARRLLARGGSLLLALGPRAANSTVELAKGFGLNLDTPGREVHDFSSPRSSADGRSFSSDAFAGFAAGRGYGPVELAPGVVPVMVPTRSELASALLRGSPAAFGARPGERDLGASGGGIALVTAVETRSAGRAVVLAGLGALGGRESQQFRRDVLAWGLRERGVLRAVEARHWKEGGFGDRAGGMYRIKDELGFAVRLEEWRRDAAEGGGWVPFKADDVQVELRMLDPYVRKGLKYLGEVRNDPHVLNPPPPPPPPARPPPPSTSAAAVHLSGSLRSPPSSPSPLPSPAPVSEVRTVRSLLQRGSGLSAVLGQNQMLEGPPRDAWAVGVIA